MIYLLISIWCLIAIDFTDALAVVKYPDIFKDCHFCFLNGFKMLLIQPFLFQRAPETFHWCIIPTITFAPHAHDKSDFLFSFAVIIVAVLASTVKIKYAILYIAGMVYGILQCMEDQFFVIRPSMDTSTIF